ncbi:protein PTHB1 isoform X2 [Epargyreus clarus]
MTIGPFGSSKARDLFCIQALDGTLSFFDQDTFLFMCIFNDIIVPGPVCYIANSDLFVMCKSNWVMEIFSYQQLEEFSELNARQNKKNIPQWTYNAGEEILSIQVIRTSSNFSSVVALGERHLYCFQDNGLMKFMIRFNYIPICFHAYLIGWYYEPSARLLIMVASDDSKLFVYEGTTLLWSCDLLDRAIAVSRCFVNSLPGGLVTLSTKGIINVCYLGTEPDLNSNAAPINDAMDPRQVQAELEAVEESLQNVLDSKEDTNDYLTKIDQIIKIKADVGKPVQNLFTTSMKDNDQVLHLLMCPVVVMLTCEDPKLVQSIQITYDCSPPFECSEPTICLDTINGTEIVEIQVFLTSEADISDTWIRILFTIIDSAGKIYVLPQKALLPLSLYCSPVTADTDNSIQINLLANHPCDLKEIFTDFTTEELLINHEPKESITFLYRTTKQVVTVKNNAQWYSIEASEFSDISPLLDNFINKLIEYHTRMGTKKFRVSFQLNMELIKQIIHKFLKSIEAHAKERITLQTMENELSILQRQFMVIQKRLLVQYGSLPPGDCEPLEFLMRDTHERLLKSAESVIESREKVCRAGCTLSAVGNLVTCILKHTVHEDFTFKLIDETLSLSSLYEHSQEWEEAVTQATSYLLNNVIKKSEKDKEKLATITDQDVLSHINLKKFLKQLRIVLEKMFTDATEDLNDGGKVKITRIEELVEVL